MKAIVVTGGDAVPEDAVHLVGADLIVAADSGSAWVDALGVRPDVLVGDMDSIDASLLNRLTAAGSTIARHPTDKDQSDAELAVERAIEAGADEVLVLGALGGGRVDHELANLFMLADPRWLGAGLRIVRAGSVVRAVGGGDGIGLEGGDGDLVTLLPIGGDAVGVSTNGLRFSLHGESLPLGRSRGLSNVVEHAPASVSLERGTLLVIETRRERAT